MGTPFTLWELDCGLNDQSYQSTAQDKTHFYQVCGHGFIMYALTPAGDGGYNAGDERNREILQREKTE
ncbi:MAG: hypothetical protein D3926_03320 [Desulfobacteraceae bacterium]|nr:MAG: hypothetical protein D3926_03320 [Desulfobacteraceae bacterium]